MKKLLLISSLGLLLIGAGCSSSSTAVTYKTYRNSACGISFEYPSNWTATEDTKIDGVTLVSPETTKAQADFAANSAVNGGEPGPSYDFSAHCWPTYTTFAQYNAVDDELSTAKNFTSLMDLLKDGKRRETTLDGATTLDGQPASNITIGGIGSTYEIWAEHGSFYALSLPNDTKDTQSVAAAHILATFQFSK